MPLKQRWGGEVTDSYSTAVHPMIDALLLEPQPPCVVFPYSIPDSPGWVDQALAGFLLAAKSVHDATFQYRLADWRARQDKLLGFRSILDREALPRDIALGQLVAEGKVSVSKAIFGTDRRQEMMDEMQTMLQWAAQLAEESARKLDGIDKGVARVLEICNSCSTRVREIDQQAHEDISRVDPAATPTIDSIVDTAHHKALAVTKVAVQKIKTQTRFLLNLDENTVAVSVDDWLVRHGLVVA
ncbi:hypothetical protein E3G54_004984 [Mycobacteroides abscessus]|nr:hypothetical protein [Mycobacteroides abscessus]